MKSRSESNCLPHQKIILSENLINNFWAKVQKSDENDCWNWLAFKSRRGYGRMGIGNGRQTNAHRISWVIHNGDIPDRMFVCHKCDNTSCVNPKHLFIGTRQDNTNDMMIKKRGRHFSGYSYYGVREEERYDGPNRQSRWRSFIVKDEKMIYLGAHTSVLEAARNYDRIAYIVFGERERLNFPDEYDLNHYK